MQSLYLINLCNPMSLCNCRVAIACDIVKNMSSYIHIELWMLMFIFNNKVKKFENFGTSKWD